jgi:hypothetical protein
VAEDRVTERDRGERGSTRETIRDGSRRIAAFTGVFRGASPLAIGVTGAGLGAAVLLVLSEVSTVASVDVASGSCEVINDSNPELADRCELSGFERNGGAFLLIALLAAVMAYGAGLGGSRPAAVALAAIGAAVLAWTLLVDLPVTDDTGAIGRNFEGATAEAGPGLTLELVAGAVALAAGAIGALGHGLVARK